MMKVLVAISLLSISASVSAAIPVEQALELCRAEQNALRRLTCYDSITTDSVAATSVQANTTDNAASPALATTQAAALPVETSNKPNSNFGLEHKNISKESTDSIAAIVTAVTYSPRKELIIDFDNGQRWRQIGSDYYSIKTGQKHKIERGVLNSFLLGNYENSRTIRVKREK